MSAQIKELSRREGATLFMTLLAAFLTLLHRCAGQDDVAVGCPVAGRNRVETETLIGVFINTLVLRGDLSGDPTFRELLRQVRRLVVEAQANQDLPFEEVVNALQPRRDLGRTPLFQVLFQLRRGARRRMALSGLTIESAGLDTGIARFDLNVEVVENERSLTCVLEYNSDLFEAPTAARMLEHFERLLAGIVASPETRISKLPLLGQDELRQLLVTWNDTAAEYPSELCVHQLFELQAHRTPAATAVVFDDRELTYAELNSQANRLAIHLCEIGVTPGALVGVFLDRSPELVIALVAILKAGGAYLPLDPAYPEERLAFILQNSGARLLVTERRLSRTWSVAGLRVVFMDSDGAAITRGPFENLPNPASPEGLAYVMYTSGSTGRPKGVAVPHRAITRLLFGVNYARLGPSERILQLSSISFDFSTFEIWGALLHGGSCVLYPGRVPNARELGRVVHERGVTTVAITAGLFNALIDEAPETLAGVKQLLVGGEALSVKHVRRALDRLPAAEIVNAYGPTESTTFACCYRVSRPLPADCRAIPIGRPIANTAVYVLDKYGNPVPVGIPGELHIGGPGLAQGYLNRPELTAEKFVTARPAGGKQERLYKTGDWVRYLADGNIEFLGRTDDQVKIRGFRVELGEIEAALEQHAAVERAAVTARGDSAGDKRLVAYVTRRPGQDLTAGAMQQFLEKKLPDYMVPAAFMVVETLPLTVNGKVDRRALPAPDWERQRAPGVFAAPRNEMERAVARLWAEVLHLDRVGIFDDFFQLGGHSLTAIRLVARISSAFSIDFPVRLVFEAPTVAAMAAAIARMSPSPEPMIPRRSEAGPAPLSFAQQRLWFLHQLNPTSPLYNIPWAARLAGPLSVPALKAALNALVARHEILRTTIRNAEAGPVQVAWADAKLELVEMDLSSISPALREREAQRAIRDEARRPFDLSRDLMLRALLARVAAEEYILSITLHHIAGDGWSMGVLAAELRELYAASVGGKRPELAELPIQYADYAVWQRDSLTEELLKAQTEDWARQLAGVAALQLPYDHPRPAAPTHRGGRERAEMPGSLVSGIEALGRAEGATLFMTLLAAFQTLLHRCSRQTDISVGFPAANRARPETQPLIGFLVNTLVLRTGFGGDPTFRQLLARVRRAALDAYRRQDVPFEKLVEILQPDRHLSLSPLFQVMYSLEENPAAEIDLPGTASSPVELETGTAKFDLTLSLRRRAGGCDAVLEYSADLFEATSARRMLQHFCALAQAAVAEPDSPVSRLPLLAEQERRRVILDWNSTDGPYPQSCIHDLFELQAARRPHATAVVFAEDRLSYGELNRRANAVARGLRRLGVGQDMPVGILATRSLGMMAGLLGILKAGGAYLPLDPAYPEERLNLMLSEAGVSLVIGAADGARPLPKLSAQVVELDGLLDAGRLEEQTVVPGTTPDSLACLMYTSGSTGRPKAVEVPHRAVIRLLFGVDYVQLGEREVLLQLGPLSFDASTFEIWGALLHGGTCVLYPNELPTARGLSRQIRENGVTTVFLTTALFHSVVDEAPEALRGVRELIVGGEILSAPHVRKAMDSLPDTRLSNAYGPTESATFTTCYPIPKPLPNTVSRIPIGRPIGNTRVYILDAHLQPVPTGVPGELHIAGDGLARGYRNQKELTSERFITARLWGRGEERLYKTGDIARYLPDGSIEFLGRTDSQVKIRGFRVEPGELEAVLSEHPSVSAAAVTVCEKGRRGKLLAAYVSGSPGHTPSATELRDWLRRRLPGHMLPSALAVLPALPLTPNGKVDRTALPPPQIAAPEEKSCVAPRDDVEARLAAIWEKILPGGPVGAKQDFFDLGGNSLLVMRMLARVEREFGVSLPPAKLFEAPTIESLAAILRQKTVPAPKVVELQPSGARPPLFFVQPLPILRPLLRRLDAGQPVLGLPLPEASSASELSDVARLLALAVRQRQPQGPYFLGGWCAYGRIAYEVAQQLQDQGQPVPMVVLFDSPARDGGRWRRRFGQEVSYHLASLSQSKPSEAFRYVLERLYRVIRLGRNGAGGREPMLGPKRLLRRIAATPPETAAYQGRLLILRSQEFRRAGESNARQGWEAVASGHLEIVDVPGTHVTMFLEPNVGALARELNRRLREYPR